MIDAVTLKDLLLIHLEFTFEKEAWQPSLLMAVDGLTARQAAWKPGPDRHSIWQIVRHFTHWKKATFAAWNGTRRLFDGRESTPYFREMMSTDWQEAWGDDAAWQADLKALHEVSHAIKENA